MQTGSDLSRAIYLPITLCNVDYKVYTKPLTNRLQSVICGLIGSHQTCGILLDSCSARCGKEAMLQTDFANAFDWVHHGVLFNVLSHVRCGAVILDGVHMAHRNCSTRLIINSILSAEIEIMSSIRQGCPFSPLLFSLYLETFYLSVASRD